MKSHFASYLKVGMTWGLLWFWLQLFIISCDVPRNNPLDPYGSNYNVANPNLPLPGYLSLECVSKHTVNWSGREFFSVSIKAEFSGFPSIIEVKAVDEYLNDFNFTMDVINNALWEADIDQGYLNSGNIYNNIGENFCLYIECASGLSYVTNDFTFTRVIDNTPNADFPNSGVDTYQYPIFTWSLPDTAYFLYDYHFRLSVKRQNAPLIYLEVDNIPADSLSFQNDTPLQEGNTEWWVSIVDNHGNYSSSKSNLFHVTIESNP